jgi:predicted transcriptional regulator YdeE/catechol 2,3-dioxygenase-like lactoylglutathione lyase family enzyme
LHQSSNFEIVARDESWFVGLNTSGPFATARQRVMRSWHEIKARQGELPASVDRSRFIAPSHGRQHEFTYYVGFAAPTEVLELPEGMHCFQLPAKSYAFGSVRGPAEEINRTYAELPKWARTKGWEVNKEILWLEIYPEPPSDDPTDPFHFDIYLPVRPANGVSDDRLLGRVTHVQLPVGDLRQAIEWYTGTLGFDVYHDSNGDHAILSLKDGPTLFLWETSDPTRANFVRGGGPMPTIGISCRNAEELRQRVIDSGAQIDSMHVEPHFATFLKFFDPFGNMIVAHQDQPRTR